MYKSTDSTASGRDYPFVYTRVPDPKTDLIEHVPKVDSVRINRTKVSSPLNMAPHLFGQLRYDTATHGARNPVLANSLKE